MQKLLRRVSIYQLLAVVALLLASMANAQVTTVFNDDMSANQNNTYTTTGVISSSAWTASRSGADWGARRATATDYTELTNDVGGTANANGWVMASTSMSSFAAPHNTTLQNNTGLITWTFNMRQITTDPGGFTAGSYGVAFILAGQGTTNNNTGNGYAVVLGQSGTTDPVRLVRYAGGIQTTHTTLLTSNTTGLTDFGANYLSVRVTYDPSNNQWEMFLRNDGNTGFTDPTTGTLVSQGTVTDNTYTNTALTLMGAWWQGATATTQTAFFDNIRVTQVTPLLSTSVSSLTYGYQASGTNSGWQSFNLSAINLVGFPANITVTAPSQFQVSNDNTTWGSSTTIAYTSATLAATPVYVRFSPTSTGAKSGNITFSVTGGVTYPTVGLTGTGSSNKTWAGGASGNWNTAGSWSPSGVPGTGDFVTFNTPSTIAVAVDTAPATLGAMTFSGNASVTFTSNGGGRTITINSPGAVALNVNSGSTVILRGSTGSGTRSMNIAFTGTGNIATIAGTLSVTDTGEGSSYDAANTFTTVTGTLRNDGSNGGTEATIDNTSTATLTFAAGGTYNHALDGGLIPTATWNAASNCNITGVTATVPTDTSFAQAFGNFTWNCPSQTGNLSLVGYLTDVNGNFTVISTNTGSLRLSNSGVTETLDVAGNFTMTGGNFFISGSGNNTWVVDVNGAFALSGGTFNMAGSTGTVTLNVKGNYTMSGGALTKTGAATTTINFNGTTTQTYLKTAGTISAALNFGILSGATVDFGTSVIDGSTGTFALASGGKIITSNNAGLTSSGATGTIQVGGTRTYNSGASYEFRGSNTGAFTLSTANTITGTLTFNRSAGVTIDQNFTATTLALTSGAVTTGALAITIPSGGTYTGGSSTAYVNGILKRVFPSPSTLVFPIGKGGNYRPVTFQVVTLTGTCTLTMEQMEAAITGTLPAGVNLNSTRNWEVSQTGATAGTYKITLDGTGDTTTGPIVMLKKESGTITSNATTTPNYTNTTAFNSMVGVNNMALASSCAVTSVAGSNQSICNGSSTVLAANTPTYGTGAWTVSGPSNLTSQFSSTSNPTATFTPAGGAGTYTLTWTITNGNCNSSSNLTVTVGSTKTWNGTSWSPSAPTSIDAAVISGNYTTNPTHGNINACSLTVNSSAVVLITTGYDVTLNGALTVSSGSFTLENNANLIQSSNAANSGNIIVKRNSSALLRQDYTLWSSPVGSQNLLTFSPLTVSTRFYTYNSSSNNYVSTSPSNNFTPGVGYLIRMPNNASAVTPTIYPGQFTGIPNNGNVPFTMSNTYNLVGNPYPSPISMSTFVSENTASITGTLYFWRETNLNTTNNAYCTWAGGTFVTNGEAQVYNPAGIIQTGQGFFVAAKSGMTALNFNNTQRVNNHANQFFRNATLEERNTVWLNITNTTGAFSQMAVGYITDATQGEDAFDGKFLENGDTSLNSILNDESYAIQGRALPFQSSDVVNLRFKTLTAGDYTIAIDHVVGLFEGDQNVFIKDNLTNVVHNLKTSAYTFASEAGTFSDRFELIFDTQLTTIQPQMTENNVIVYKQDQQLVINSGAVKMSKVTVYDIRGRQLIEKTDINASEVKLNTGTTNQVLIVKITSTDNKTVTKKAIN